MALRGCLRPGCQALVVKGYCEACRPKHGATARNEERRGSSTQRGYGYRWQQFRKWYLEKPENVLCADCGREQATDVHHVAKVACAPERQYDEANLMPLCGGCHKARTARGE